MSPRLQSFDAAALLCAAVMALAIQACGVLAKGSDVGAQGGSGGQTLGMGGQPIVDPGFSSMCLDQTGICQDCIDFSCTGPGLNCQRAQGCMEPEQRLVPCLRSTCDFGACLTTFGAADPSTKPLSDCISTKCSVRCSGSAPTGDVPTGDVPTGGGAGGAGTGGAGPAPCKALSDECSEGLNAKCGAEGEACTADPACSEALAAYTGCLFERCDRCVDTLAGAGSLAKAVGECLQTKLAMGCF